MTVQNITKDTSTGRVVYLDLLRIVSMAGVVLAHTAVSQIHNVSMQSAEYSVICMYCSALRCLVPLFIMISGIMFLAPERNISIRKMYAKYIFRIVLTTVFWTFIYALFDLIKGKGLRSAASTLIMGPVHMWFMRLLIGIYVLVPLLRLITERPEMIRYFMVLSFVFFVLIPEAFVMINSADMFFGTALYERILSLDPIPGFPEAFRYSFYFMLGYCLSRKDISVKQEAACYILGVICIAVTFFLSRSLSIRLNENTEIFYDNMSIRVVPVSAGIFIFFKKRVSNRIRSERVVSVIRWISEHSLAVYLLHPMVITVLKWIGIRTTSFSMLLSIPCVAAIVLLLSLAGSMVLHKIPVVNRYFV